MKTTCGKAIGLAVLVLLLLGLGVSAQAGEGRVGDVIVAVPDGKFQVWRGATLVDTVSLGTGITGRTGGCAYDSTYRLRCVDYDQAKIVKFAIPDPHAPTQTLSRSGTPQFIVFDGANNFFVGFPSPGLVEQFDANGAFQGNCTLPSSKLDSSTILWGDITGTGNAIVYASGGTKIRKLQLPTPPTTLSGDNCSVPNAANITVSFPSEFSGSNKVLFGLRMLLNTITRAVDGSGGFIVAAGIDILRVSSTGAFIKCYVSPTCTSATNGVDGASNNWRAVWLDGPPATATAFWSVNLATGHLFKFDIATGNVLAGPISTAATLSDDTGGITVNGAFSAAQPAVTAKTVMLPHPVPDTLNAANPCPDTDPNTCTLTFSGTFSSGNKLIITVTFGTTESVTYTAQFTEIDPAVGISDPSPPAPPPGSLPCLLVSTSPPKCAVYDVKFSSCSGCTANLAIKDPINPGAINTQLLLDLETIITKFVLIDEIDAGGTGTTTVYSLHDDSPAVDPAILANAASCGYEDPVKGNFTTSRNLGAAIPFKFHAVQAPNVCPTGPTFLTNLNPHLRLLQLAQLNSSGVLASVGVPISVPFSLQGGSGVPPDGYRLDVASSTWILNVDASSVPAGCYFGYTFFLPGTNAFGARFDVIPAFSYSQVTNPATVLIGVGVDASGCATFLP